MDIKYINELLEQGKTVKEVREILQVGEKKFQRDIKKLGYKFNQKSKVYEYDKEPTKDISEDNDKSMIKVIQEPQSNTNNDLILDNDKGMTLSIQEEFKENIINLANDYDKIKNMLMWFENKEYDKEHTEIIQLEQGLKIDLPESEIIRTTIRINKEIMDKFNTFSSEYKEYSKQDLYSMAFKEFMDRHKR